VRLLAAFVIATVLAVMAAGCSNSESSEPATSAPARSATETEAGGIDPLEGAGTEPVSATPAASEIALLERVAVARHEGYDRVVFQFRNVLPGYRVEYVEPPLRQDGSGNVVEVAGRAFVVVRMEQASGFDLGTAEGVLVYKGPRRISGAEAGTSVVREVVRIGDFEAVLNWAIGLDYRVDFRVLTLDGPPRLVVDVRNH
jgi:hypothetical protein